MWIRLILSRIFQQLLLNLRIFASLLRFFITYCERKLLKVSAIFTSNQLESEGKLSNTKYLWVSEKMGGENVPKSRFDAHSSVKFYVALCLDGKCFKDRYWGLSCLTSSWKWSEYLLKLKVKRKFSAKCLWCHGTKALTPKCIKQKNSLFSPLTDFVLWGSSLYKSIKWTCAVIVERTASPPKKCIMLWIEKKSSSCMYNKKQYGSFNKFLFKKTRFGRFGSRRVRVCDMWSRLMVRALPGNGIFIISRM